jgi:hypothetical protein
LCRKLFKRHSLLILGFAVVASVLIDQPRVALSDARPYSIPSSTATASAPVNNITWLAQDNPHVITGTYTIPADTTVTMEAGVVVQINQNSTLQVNGVLIGQGTAASHITITGAADASSHLTVAGTTDLTYADISARTHSSNNASLLFDNCRWFDNGSVSNGEGYLYTNPPYVQFEHCSFEGPGSGLGAFFSTVAMRDVAFTGGAYGIFAYAYVYLDNVRSDNSKNVGLQFKIDERLYINNVQIRNAAWAALDLGGGNGGGNFLLGPNNVLQNSLYPVLLESGGLLPGSVVPASGNTNNYIPAGGSPGPGAPPGEQDWRGGITWAPLAVPYVIRAPLTILGRWTILPGTTVQFGPDFSGIADRTGGLIARGTRTSPILFQRFDPAQPWGGISYSTVGNRIANVTLEGSSSGVGATPNNGAMVYVEDMIMRNNEAGSHGSAYVIGSRFLDNNIGYDGVGNLNAGPASPNSFERNTIAARTVVTSTVPARENWWNSPTGPTHPNNPEGAGDPVVNGVIYIPFLTAPPDYSDAPPFVRQHKPDFTYNPGDKVTISWDSSDDHGIVEHRILFSPAGNFPTTFQTVIDHLPGTARSYEWTVPDIGFQTTDPAAFIRVLAVDTFGHERFDDQGFQIPSGEVTGNLVFTSPAAGQTFKPGQKITFGWTQSGFTNTTNVESFVYLENEQRTVSQGGAFVTTLTGTATMPYTSTDRARILSKVFGSRNRVKYFYSPYFSIRPDSRLPDAPPTIALQTPQAGASFPAGTFVPISWTASDDEAMGSFDIQISYDGGRGWTKIGESLPGTTRNYDFQTALGSGFADVRVKVIGFDRRFQQTSSGAERQFSLTPTPPPNHFPTLSLTKPTVHSIFLTGTNLLLGADAADSDGTISQVDFYDGATLIGSDNTAPYEISWNNAPAGSHTLTAKATDNAGGATTSSPVTITINAQPVPPTTVPGAGVQWAALYNGPANQLDQLAQMAIDGQGNVYRSGRSVGIGTGTDIATIKYDTNGNLLWVARFNGTGNGSDTPSDLAVDASGNVYVTGSTWRDYNFNGGNEYDSVTLKYDPTGNLLWLRYYSGNNALKSDEGFFALELDQAGNVYVTGGSLYTGYNNFLTNSVATIKYDASGNEIWVRTYDTADKKGAVGVDLKVDASGGVYITGTVKVNTVNVNTTTDNVLTLKYDAAGTLVWARQYDDPGQAVSDFDRGKGIHLDGQGNIYVLGANVNQVNTSNYDVLLLKYTDDGSLVKVLNWDSTIDVNMLVNDNPNDWVFDSSGSFYITGTSDSQAEYGVIFTLKFDSNLTLQWARNYQGPTGTGFDGGYAIALDWANSIWVLGQSFNTDNDYDFLLLKYLPNGTEDGVRRYEGPAQLDDHPQDIAIDSEGNIYLGGDTRTATGAQDFLTLKITGLAAGAKQPATVTLEDLSQAYDGTAKSATATTTPANLNVSISYSQSGVPVGSPTNAGSYDVVATINDSQYQGSASGTLVINKAGASLALSNLNQTYDGVAKAVAVATNPNGLSGVSVTYDGSTTLPINAGSYSVTVSLSNSNYQAPNVNGSLVISKAAATLALNNLNQTYDGVAKAVTVATNPNGLSGVSVTYDGSTSLPINAGSYSVTASLSNSNYQAPNVNGTLVISKAAATLALNNLNQTYDGVAKAVTVATNPNGLSGVSVTYNGSANPPSNAGSYAVTASLRNNNNQAPSVDGTLVISKATPQIIWQRPAAIVYGRPLTSAQLNATADVQGTFTYNPASGTVLPVGIDLPLFGSFTPTDTLNYSGSGANTFISVQPATFSLLTEENSDYAIALDAFTLMRGPFTVTTWYMTGQVSPTRVMLFAKDLNLAAGENTSTVTVEAENSHGTKYPLDVDAIVKIPGYDWLTQINVRLPQELAGAGNVGIRIRYRGTISNTALIIVNP